jgi:hypothetical protein
MWKKVPKKKVREKKFGGESTGEKKYGKIYGKKVRETY